MSFRFSFQASLPQSIRLAVISLAVSRSCLGFCLLQGFGRTYRRNAAGTTPQRSSASGFATPQAARSLSAHGFDGSAEMISDSPTKCFATRLPVHPCGVARRSLQPATLPVPTAY
jgi:hypothetical protein